MAQARGMAREWLAGERGLEPPLPRGWIVTVSHFTHAGPAATPPGSRLDCDSVAFGACRSCRHPGS